MSKTKISLTLLSCALIFGVILFAPLSSSLFGGTNAIIPAAERNAKRPAVRVISTKVVFTENDIQFEALGNGRAIQSVELYPAVNEEVRSVHFSAGDKVTKDTVLVQLDDDAERLALDLAKVELSEAKRLLTRYERAVQDGAVPESEVDSARAAVDAAEVALHQAELAIRYRKIRAPFTGYVGIPRFDAGERVTSSTLLTGLDDRSTLLVDFEVPEKLAASVTPGLLVEARTPAYPGVLFEGKVASVESRIERQSRTLLTRATFSNDNDTLKPGMSFSLQLNIPGERFPTVPEIAVQWGDDGAYVWLVRNNQAQRVAIHIVERSAGRVLVDGDIEEGELVVVEGLQRLEEGREVQSLGTIKNAAAPTLPSEKPLQDTPSSTPDEERGNS